MIYESIREYPEKYFLPHRMGEDDKYKRGTMAGIVLTATFLLLASDGMGIYL